MCQITHGQAGYWKPGEDETVNPWIMYNLYMYKYIRKYVRFKWSHTHWRITIQSLPEILATSLLHRVWDLCRGSCTRVRAGGSRSATAGVWNA